MARKSQKSKNPKSKKKQKRDSDKKTSTSHAARSGSTLEAPEEARYMPLDEAQSLAEDHYRAGRFVVCRNVLQQILNSQPKNAPALNQI